VRGAANGKQSIYDADYQSLQGFRALAHEFNVAILIVHHLRKVQGDDVYDDVNGTLGLTGATDTNIILKRTTDLVELHATGKDIPPLENVIEFDMTTFRWGVLGNIGEVVKDQTRQDIIDVLHAEKKSMTPKEIAECLGVPNNRIKKMLTRMFNDGQVIKEGYGKYKPTISNGSGEDQQTKQQELAVLLGGTSFKDQAEAHRTKQKEPVH
jgi:predicted transcriptional regulator